MNALFDVAVCRRSGPKSSRGRVSFDRRICQFGRTFVGSPPTASPPIRSCFRLVLPSMVRQLVCCPPKSSRFRTGDFRPTSSRPCWA